MKAMKIKPAPRGFDLQAFCCTDENRNFHLLGTPFRQGERVYATNGRVAVEVPARAADEIIEEGKAPDMGVVFNWPESMCLEPWPKDAKPVEAWGFCPNCKGSGYHGETVDCPKCGHSFSEDRCEECLGDPEGVFDWQVQIGEYWIDVLYYRLICSLPGDVKYAVSAKQEDSVYFRIMFNGGRAVAVSLYAKAALRNIEKAKEEMASN